MNKEQRRQEWMARIAEYQASGQTLKAWCSEHGLSINRLKYWLYKTKTSSKPTAASTDWLTITLPETTVPSSGSLPIHIGSARIEVGPGFSPQLLRDVVRALSTSC